MNSPQRAVAGVWMEVATGVLDGSGFYIQFAGPSGGTGQIAY
ncbi:hypothetical protein ACIBBB_00495 [Streptomyces sp. NPDC051217]